MYKKSYRRKGTSKKMSTLKRKSKKISSKSSKSFKKKVLAVIHRQAENKVYIAYGANNSITTVVGATPTNINLVPPITQGVGHSQRVGDNVNIRYARVHGHINILPYNSISNPTVGPLYVKLWLFSVKNFKNSDNLSTSTINTNFFETNSGSTGMQGNMLDIELSINKQNFTVYATKTYLLSSGPTQGSTYYNSAGASCGATGRFSVPFSFSYAKHMKTLKYDDTSPVQPTNRNMWLAFQAVYADGTSLALTTAEYHYNLRVEFEDM